jgi:hypothetical protein
MPKQTKSQIATYISQLKRGETAFWKSTAAQRRVLIAKDVLKQIASKRLVPTTGVYTRGRLKSKPDASDSVSTIGAREAIAAMPKCTACAVGSVLVSGALLGNRCTLGDLGQGYTNTENLSLDREHAARYFTISQLDLMEVAFEGDELGWLKISDKQLAMARAFHNKHGTDKECLIAIMKNVIRNEGTFKP